jgi:hypothetical protein
MKKSIIIILIAIGISASLFAGNANIENHDSQNPEITIIQKLPYSSYGKAMMEMVYTKDEYSLWKCPSSSVTNFPGTSITGNTYNYFVYKNGNFHLTVNENNKNDVYQFLTN